MATRTMLAFSCVFVYLVASDAAPQAKQKCYAHKDCHGTQFCSAKAKHKNQCLPCQVCHSNHDSIDSKCPGKCIAHAGTTCKHHNTCTKAEFCSLRPPGEKNTHSKPAEPAKRSLASAATSVIALKQGLCHACQFCHQGNHSIDHKCPKKCLPKTGSSCGEHGHCDPKHEFCSAMTELKNQCAPCQFCEHGRDSVDKKCPKHCMPAVGSECDAHHKCDHKKEFCSKTHKEETSGKLEKAMCRPCQYCTKKDSLDGVCPSHCIPPFGSHCDGHHHCDATHQFCAATNGHNHTCISCKFCKFPADSVDGACPEYCAPLDDAKSCTKHDACTTEQFCSKKGKHKNKCTPCQFCRNGKKDSIDKKCPKHCIAMHMIKRNHTDDKRPLKVHADTCHKQQDCKDKGSGRGLFCYKGGSGKLPTLTGGLKLVASETFANKCIPCQFCHKGSADAVGGKCPVHCIPPLGTRCDKHDHCDADSEFCSAITGHKNQCVSCNYCNHDKDAIGGSCPERCIPQLGAACDASHPCDPFTEFCGKEKHGWVYKNRCVACQYCTRKMAIGQCPATCTTPIGMHCDGHHHCDGKSEYCSKVADPSGFGESLKNRCAPCNECTKNAFAVDGKCPKHCIPPTGALCTKHESCASKSDAFCAKQYTKDLNGQYAHKCAPCNYCTDPHKDSVDGKCPKHCSPPIGAMCDAHHRCNPRTEFCAKRDIPFHGAEHSCTPCHFCTHNRQSIDGKCPVHCIKKQGMNSRTCNKDNYHAVCKSHGAAGGEFCSAISKHKDQCVGCQFCRRGEDSIDSKCPHHCVAGTALEGVPSCLTHEQCKPAHGTKVTHFCSKIPGKSTMHKCLSCNHCKENHNAVDNKCPEHCKAAHTHKCSSHHECGAGQFCSNHEQCRACPFCHRPHDAIDGKCPLSCIPKADSVQTCRAHHSCKSEQFCSSDGGIVTTLPNGKKEHHHKNTCLPCNYCSPKHAVGGACPEHCIPLVGTSCDAHHHCDEKLEFCSLIKGHKHKCLNCKFCHKGSQAVGGNCPKHCVLKNGHYGGPCRADKHHTDCHASAFCSVLASFRFKCLPCDVCTDDAFAADGKCPHDACLAHQRAVAKIKADVKAGVAVAEDAAAVQGLESQDAQWRAAIKDTLKAEEEELLKAQRFTEEVTEVAAGIIVLAVLGGALACFCSWKNREEIKTKVEHAIVDYEKRMQRRGGRQQYVPTSGTRVELTGLTFADDGDEETMPDCAQVEETIDFEDLASNLEQAGDDRAPRSTL